MKNEVGIQHYRQLESNRLDCWEFRHEETYGTEEFSEHDVVLVPVRRVRRCRSTGQGQGLLKQYRLQVLR
jgi:hypothetical protein